PHFLTIDPESLAAARGKYSAVIVVHLFGQMADVPALMEAAGDVPVIEDAAHAPMSSLYGRRAGSFGVASFYSFASTKYWPAGGGGLAVLNYLKLVGKITKAIESLSPPSRLRELRNVILQSAKAAVFSRPFYGVFGMPMRRWADEWALLEPEL